MSKLKSILYRVIPAIALLFFVCSCQDEYAENKLQPNPDKGVLKQFSVLFDVPTSYGVSGTIKTRVDANGEQSETEFVEPNELTRASRAEDVNDVWILQYDNVSKHLIHSEYSKVDGSLGTACASIKLDTTSISSDVYFIVNTGDSMLFYVNEPYTVEQLNDFRVGIESEEWVDSLGVPMLGLVQNVDFRNSMLAHIIIANVHLQRVVAKLNVEVYVYKDIDINTVTLCGVPSTYSPVGVDTAKTEVRIPMNFTKHDWTDGDVVEKIYNSGTYKVRTFTWYIPGYNPAALSDRAYVQCEGKFANKKYICKFRLYGADRDSRILANQEYLVTDILTAVRECGDDGSDAFLELVAGTSAVNMSLNEKGEEEGANCYVANTENNSRLLFTFPVIQYERYVEQYGTVDHVTSLTDNKPWTPEIIWKTNSHNINTEISEYSGYGVGYITLKLTPLNSDPEKCFSNVLIGLKDFSGKLLWSWHIWIAPKDILADTLSFNGATTLGYQIGASKSLFIRPSTDPLVGNDFPSTRSEWANMIGLYYQWGRKDPMFGPLGDITQSNKAQQFFGDHSAPSAANTDYVILANKDNKTVESMRQGSISHPTLFVLGSTENNLTFDWMGSDGDISWNTKKDGSGGKTVFDPCPPGFMVMPIKSNLIGQSGWTDYMNNVGAATNIGRTAYAKWATTTQMNSWSTFSRADLLPYAWFDFKSDALKNYTMMFPACGCVHKDGYFYEYGYRLYVRFGEAQELQRIRGWYSSSKGFNFQTNVCAGTVSPSGSALPVIAVKVK